MKRENIIIATGLFVFIFVASLVSVSMVASNVLGWNNSTTITRAYVWNTEPNITSVTISPDPIDLTPGNTTNVNCTAYVWDYNGWADVNVSNATFYHISVGNDAEDDSNTHYTADVDNDCSCTGSDNEAICNCTFDIWYYATNGTWICNMTVTDQGGEATERQYYLNSSNNASATVNTVVAINVPAEIDYGNLSVTETSSDMPANISNFGNTPINISVRGYGGTTNPDNPGDLCMECAYGNISIEYEKYSLASGTDYSVMTALTNASTEMDLSLPVRTDDNGYGNDTNTTYWKLQIPLSIGGICNGTLVFVGQEN